MAIIDRADLPAGVWDAFVDAHPGGWFYHTSHWLDYSLAYTPGAVDQSFVVTSDGEAVEIVALVPLITLDGNLVHGGQITPAPILKLTRSAAAAAMASTESVERVGVPLPIQMRPGVVPQGQPPQGTRLDTVGTYVIDVYQPEATLWRNLRKSYKSLIRKAERTYVIAAYGTPKAVQFAYGLHRKCAGRETRSSATWELMAAWATAGFAFTVVASTTTLKPVAYAYIIKYKEWSYYASGASDEADVAHALQWHAIKTLKAGGYGAYEIGAAAMPQSTTKDKGIAHFKAGFGGREVPVGVLRSVSS